MEKSQDCKTARFVFERWEDTELKRKYRYLSTFVTEARDDPEYPEIFRWIATMYFPVDETNKDLTEQDLQGDWEDGMILEVTYYWDSITPEDIEQFFKDFKIHVHRANPFIVENENVYSITRTEAIDFIHTTKQIIKKFSDNDKE